MKSARLKRMSADRSALSRARGPVAVSVLRWRSNKPLFAYDTAHATVDLRRYHFNGICMCKHVCVDDQRSVPGPTHTDSARPQEHHRRGARATMSCRRTTYACMNWRGSEMLFLARCLCSGSPAQLPFQLSGRSRHVPPLVKHRYSPGRAGVDPRAVQRIADCEHRDSILLKPRTDLHRLRGFKLNIY